MELVEIHLDSVGSTNAYAKEHGKKISDHQIICITAEEQTAGYGRFNRPWASPRSQNIYATFAFRLPLHTLHLTSLSQIMTVSLAAVLLKESLHPQIRWPNDILLGGKKMAGVLAETEFHADSVDIFLGIGVNVNMDSADLSKIDQPATSLKVETGHPWDRDGLLKKLQKQFLADLQKFKKEGFSPFHSQFENLLAYKGEIIRCQCGGKEWVGICHSITSDGQLNLYLPNKEIRTILSGDVLLPPHKPA